MATIVIRGRKRRYTAIWRDSAGTQLWRATKTTNKKEAQEMADQWEGISRTPAPQVSVTRMQRVVSEMHQRIMGREMQRTTLNIYAQSWLELRKAEVAKDTFNAYSAAVDNFVAFMDSRGRAGVELYAVTRDDIQAWRDHRRKEVASGTVNLALKILRIMFSAAKNNQVISDDPTEGVRIVKKTQKESHGEARPFTIEELQQVLDVCDEEWQSMVTHGYYTGQRLKDLALMKAGDVDVLKRQVKIKTIKTGTMVIIEMSEPYLNWFLAQGALDDAAAYLHTKCAATVRKNDRAGTLSNRFGKILARAGLREHQPHVKQEDKQGRGGRRSRNSLSFHSLRHTMVSELAKKGVSRSLVQDMVGHENAAVNASYTHFDSTTKLEAMSELPDITRLDCPRQMTFEFLLTRNVKKPDKKVSVQPRAEVLAGV